MQYTSAEAAKLLRQINEELEALFDFESMSKSFVAAVGEDIESVRPEYDYVECQKKINDLEQKVLVVKHAINSFNVSHILPDFNISVDQALVYIPQLNKKKSKLMAMKSKLPKKRVCNYNQTQIIDYEYANYDISEVEKDYQNVSEELSKLQIALDFVNSTEKMEIDL